MTTEKKVARRKLTLLELSGQLGNPSASSGQVVSKVSVVRTFETGRVYLEERLQRIW
jgi:hypothetical protein